jgi:hypothetical protein
MEASQSQIPSLAGTRVHLRTQRYGVASIEHLLLEGQNMGKRKDVPLRMNRQLTCASTRQGKKGKFRRFCPCGIALQMIAFEWQHRCDLDFRHILRYFREDPRGPGEFDRLQEDERI